MCQREKLMDLIERIDEIIGKYNSYSDNDLLKTFRDVPDKEKYKELKKRNLHKHPLVKSLIR